MIDDFPPPPNSVLSRWDRRQRYLLYFGALYDGGFGVPVFLFPIWSIQLLGLPEPGAPPIWLRLNGIFLIVVALIYIVSARDPQRYLGNVLVAIFGKVVSVIFYVCYWVTLEGGDFLLVLAVLDAIVGVLHTWFIGPNRRAKVRAALRPARAVD